jgi:hypothetical protein
MAAFEGGFVVDTDGFTMDIDASLNHMGSHSILCGAENSTAGHRFSQP